jgi:hypothetical protein
MNMIKYKKFEVKTLYSVTNKKLNDKSVMKTAQIRKEELKTF